MRSTDNRDICALSSSRCAMSHALVNRIWPPKLKHVKGGVRFSSIVERTGEISRVRVTLLSVSFLLGGPARRI